MTDVFHEPYWTIEEIAVWARCRDRHVVYLLQTPALDVRHAERNEYLDLRVRQAALSARGRGRNIERELWEAWGRPTPLSSLIAPYLASDQQGSAECWTSNDFAPEWRALAEAYGKLSLYQRQVADALDLVAADRSGLEVVAQLPSPFDVLVGDVLASRSSAVTPTDYLPIFPIVDYLLQMLRLGRFKAVGNLPNDPLAHELSLSDWRGLRIALASDTQRLCVWRDGNSLRAGAGDVENVRIARDAVLMEFPGDPPPPQATVENARRLIREAMASRGGFISQKNGAKIVKDVFSDFSVARAMELTKALTGNTKRGPRGPRKKLSE